MEIEILPFMEINLFDQLVETTQDRVYGVLILVVSLAEPEYYLVWLSVETCTTLPLFNNKVRAQVLGEREGLLLSSTPNQHQ